MMFEQSMTGGEPVGDENQMSALQDQQDILFESYSLRQTALQLRLRSRELRAQAKTFRLKEA